MVFNFIGGGLYGLSITNVSGDVCIDGSGLIFVLLDHPIGRKTWRRIPTKEVTLTASEKEIEVACHLYFREWRKTMKEMKHFEKQFIKAGETKTFRFDIDLERDFGFVNEDGKRFLEAGEYHILVQGQTVKIELID